MGSIVAEGRLTGSDIEDNLTVDPLSGKIWWRVGKKGIKAGQEAGSIHNGSRSSGGGYRRVRVNKKTCYAHHLVWGWCTGKWPDGQIDHINGNRDDNRIANLREATASQNQTNGGRRSHNTSNYKWVSRNKRNNLWHAEININGKRVFSKYGRDPAELHKAACEAAKKLHGEFFNSGALESPRGGQNRQ